MADLEQEDSALVQGILLPASSARSEEEFARIFDQSLTFSAPRSDGTELPLLPAGETRAVDFQNRNEFVGLLLRTRLEESESHVHVCALYRVWTSVLLEEESESSFRCVFAAAAHSLLSFCRLLSLVLLRLLSLCWISPLLSILLFASHPHASHSYSVPSAFCFRYSTFMLLLSSLFISCSIQAPCKSGLSEQAYPLYCQPLCSLCSLGQSSLSAWLALPVLTLLY